MSALGGDAVFAAPEAGSCVHGAMITAHGAFVIAGSPLAITGGEQCLECAYRETIAVIGAEAAILITPTPTGARVTIGRHSAASSSPAAALRELVETIAGA